MVNKGTQQPFQVLLLIMYVWLLHPLAEYLHIAKAIVCVQMLHIKLNVVRLPNVDSDLSFSSSQKSSWAYGSPPSWHSCPR